MNGVIGSAKSLCWALLLLLLVNFIFGVLFMQLSVDFLATRRIVGCALKSGDVPKRAPHRAVSRL